MNKEQKLQEDQPEKKIPAEVIPAEETSAVETKQPSDLNLKPLNPDMEVHHHTHPAHGKKTWKEYFWEFLMLFLAVFCGFLAEYQLEHTIERHREKEYIISILEDIKSDLSQADNRLKEYTTLMLVQDSLMTELSNTEIISNSNRAYYLWRNNYGFNDFIYNDRTIQQLKNSGALRMIKKKEVPGRIMKYDQAVRNVLSTQLIMNNTLAGYHVYHRLFDFIKLRQNYLLKIPVPLTEQGAKFLNEAYSDREYWKDALGFLIMQLRKVTEEGKQTIEIIKKEYHLE